MANVGDLDGDGIDELAVGAHRRDVGGINTGAVFILFLNPDGSIKSSTVIDDNSLPQNPLSTGDWFGAPTLLAPGVIAVGAGGWKVGQGGVFVLSVDSGGHVLTSQGLDSSSGGFTGILEPGDSFSDPEGIGDLDGDGIPDLAVGAQGDDDGGMNRGAVWILFLNADHTVKSHHKISSTSGDFLDELEDVSLFGRGLAMLGDQNGDGFPELAVGAYGDSDGGPYTGAVWILSLRPDGTVRSHRKISATQGGLTGPIKAQDSLGFCVASLGDWNGDSIGDIAVGAFRDADFTNVGAVWILELTDPFEPIGAGCPGSGGIVPRLRMDGTPSPEGLVWLSIDEANGGSMATLFFGTQAANLPMGHGCSLLVAPLPPVMLTLPLGGGGPGGGTIELALAIPPSVPLVSLATQAFVIDAGATGGFANSNGIAFSIH